MTDGFYPMTKWLPSYEIKTDEGRYAGVRLDADLSGWVEHLKKLGLTEGTDFEIRSRKDGKKAIFRRGKSPFCDTDKYYPHSLRSNGD